MAHLGTGVVGHRLTEFIPRCYQHDDPQPPSPGGPHNAKGTAFSAVPLRVGYVTYSALSNVTLSSTPDFFMSSTILAKSSSDALITNFAFLAMPLNAFL